MVSCFRFESNRPTAVDGFHVPLKTTPRLRATATQANPRDKPPSFWRRRPRRGRRLPVRRLRKASGKAELGRPMGEDVGQRATAEVVAQGCLGEASERLGGFRQGDVQPEMCGLLGRLSHVDAQIARPEALSHR